MAQEIEFASIPNTQPIAVPATLSLILGEVARSTPTLKAFKEFLRMRNLFDKASFEALMRFLDLKIVAEKVVLGDWAKRLFEAEDDSKMRRLLAERLIERNPLLAKYCVEAMDTEHGGRLHSTNELYRMITSYVYPGLKPTLPSFRCWVDWAVAAGLFKLVGIRWALGDVGREFLPRLRAIDVEELLEEEKKEIDEAQEVEVEEEGEATPETQAAPEPPQSLAAPYAPEPAPPPQQPVHERPKAFVQRPPIPSGFERPVVRRAMPTPEELEACRDALQAWYESYPGKRPLSMRDFGLDPSSKAPILLHEACFAAILKARGIGNEAICYVVSAFRETAVLATLVKGRIPLEALRSIMLKEPDPGVITACETVVHMPKILSGLEQLPTLLKAEGPKEFLWGLWRTLFEPIAPLAPFIFTRFLWEGERLRKNLVEAAFIPFFDVRKNAFRIGFSDKVYAGSFGELLEIATSLSSLFGPPSFEGPLAQVHEAFGCAFSCPRAAVCPLPACREKGEVSH